MLNHFLTSKYRIVRDPSTRTYKVQLKPEYSFFWRDYMCDRQWLFSTYEGALTAAIHQEKLRKGILRDEYSTEYTSDQLLNLHIKDTTDA